MFRYDERALSASMNLMQTACRELDEYEEEVRALLRMLNRDPEIPAPRRRLSKSLEKLEERETALNLTRRKLDAVRRLYENTENRIRDLADETESMGGRETEASGQGGDEKEITPFATGFLPFPRMDWVWPPIHPVCPGPGPGFQPFPIRPLRPLYPFPPRRPLVIDPDVLDVLRKLLESRLQFGTGYAPGPHNLTPVREWKFEFFPYVRHYEFREVRQARIHSLFGTDRP